MVKKKTKRVERIILQPKDDDPYKEYSPKMYFPYESNHVCFVAIECPTHKKAKDLIKQLLKDQKDLVRTKKQLKEYRDKERDMMNKIHEESERYMEEARRNAPDYNCPG